jgi:hypothetical protein
VTRGGITGSAKGPYTRHRHPDKHQGKNQVHQKTIVQLFHQAHRFASNLSALHSGTGLDRLVLLMTSTILPISRNNIAQEPL